MKKKSVIKPLIGVLCILVLILAAAVAVFLDSRSPDPILGIFQTRPTGSNEETEDVSGLEKDPTVSSEEQVLPPEDLPSSVEIPTETDPQSGGSVGIKFPYKIPEYGLIIEKMAPYSGMFVEDGSNANVQNVAMLLVRNEGKFPVEYTQISVDYGKEQLVFDVSALPVGEKLVVQEKTGKAIPAGTADAAKALVVQRANMEMSDGKISVTDNGDNTLTVRNLTGEAIPTVRVFYKYYMEQEDVFVGGISFTVRITKLGAGASVTVQPSHYTSRTSRVVMVTTYDSEV